MLSLIPQKHIEHLISLIRRLRVMLSLIPQKPSVGNLCIAICLRVMLSLIPQKPIQPAIVLGKLFESNVIFDTSKTKRN